MSVQCPLTGAKADIPPQGRDFLCASPDCPNEGAPYALTSGVTDLRFRVFLPPTSVVGTKRTNGPVGRCPFLKAEPTSRLPARSSEFDPIWTSAGETTAAFWNRVVCERRTASYRRRASPSAALSWGDDMQAMTIARRVCAHCRGIGP
jgi:hypothetical protein